MCGNRLNDWKTSPIAPPDAVDVDARRGDLLALDDDPAGVDRLEQVDAPQEGRLPRAGRADQAHDLVLGDGEVDALEDVQVAERLAQALDPERLAGLDGHLALADARRCSRRTSQSTKRAIGMVSARKTIAVMM